MIFLETDRLILRNIEKKDIDCMLDYRNNEVCAKYQRGQVKTRSEIEALMHRHQNDIFSDNAPFFISVAQKKPDDMIGEILVMPNEGTFSFGYTFSYRYHRMGYAYESLSALIAHLHKAYPEMEFISFTEPENIPSRNLLVKLGYEDLGYLPSNTSEIFGKYLKKTSYREIRNAVNKRAIF